MKKIMAIVVIIAMMAALFVPAFADSHAANVEAGEKLLEADFSGEAVDPNQIKAWDGYAIQDGALHLGHGGSWIDSSPIVRTVESFANYIASFKMFGDKRDCYYGFGLRADDGLNLMNGGRFGVLSPTEQSVGIAVDIFGAGNSTLGDNIGITFCDNGENASAPYFTLPRPEGFDPGANTEFTVADSGDKITICIGGKELVTIELSGLEDGEYTAAKAYDAAGNEVFNGSVTVLEEGTIQFYQRNNHIVVSDFTVSELKEVSETPSTSAELRGYSFDAFVTNYVDITTGEYKVVDFGPVDGSDGSISNIAYYGWIGFNEAIDSFGYQINDDAPVFDGAFAFTTEDAIKEDANGGQYGQRFLIVVPTSELKGANTIKAVVKLAGGAVVSLDGKALAEGARALPNTVVEYTGPAAPDTQPETVPQTGDATVAMFAVIAVLAMGAAVVFMKKRAF